MRPFHYSRPASLAEALLAERRASAADPHTPMAFLAGGTTLVDLMKLEVMRPQRVVDLNASAREHSAIQFDGSNLRLGAFAKMAEVAGHPDVVENFPVIAQSLSLAASAQLRNMATLGGNVLQRTRCAYFRDPSWAACNKRSPGSGCAALEGANRQHAVLGASEHCIATYPGDFAQALLVLDAAVLLIGPDGARTIPFGSLHREPGDAPHLETNLQPSEIITGFAVPAGPWARRSLYLKIRDRQSYEFAVASAAVALELDGGIVNDVRIALGGVATVPWRAHDVEDMLRGKVLDEARATEAARVAFRTAVPQSHNAFKIALGQSTVVRALLQATSMEVRHG
ncbi:MAG: xanthine dehydrogenase family protein subunit M [Chelatococcus sp.]|uniref:FAD binding domain-containing protein n=1 Tax=Chelatococcus sp. TaxID=1953771 RepID=UPI0025BF38A0|nr:xanthine dehydrogenase family protein subunit M [Chelatococcus sp.]MBX3536664.1 xanthine dehydrogenase family protein subunit M [Chelatococcus sp.]